MKVLKFSLNALLIAVLFTIIFFSCKKDIFPSVTSDAKITIADKPTVSCGAATQSSIDLVVTSGAATGAPAGFSVQWMSQTALAANGGVWYASEDPRLCKASFSGNAKDSRYLLKAGQTVTITIGDVLMDNGASLFNCGDGLECSTTYEFRVFAHANSTLTKSAFQYTECSTETCDISCGAHHFGYWKNNCDLLPADGLYLGTVHYATATLCTLLNTPGSGDGLVILAHQLIAAKANGINNADVVAADAAIGGSVVLFDPKAASWQATLSGVLNKYNNCKQ
jgi:hypothetical protein